MKTAKDIIDFIGRDEIALALNRSTDRVRNAGVLGVLPAQWYNVLEQMAGRPLPRDAFGFLVRADE